MKYNSVENAERFLKEQIAWCLANGYKDFSVWSNGKDLQCCLDSEGDLGAIFQRVELKNKGYWRAFRMVNGVQVSILV